MLEKLNVSTLSPSDAKVNQVLLDQAIQARATRITRPGLCSAKTRIIRFRGHIKKTNNHDEIRWK